jgi:membrane protein required for colicin V production
MSFGLTGWDWFVIVVAALSIGFGMVRGMVRTVFALAAWVLALMGVPIALAWILPVLPESIPAPLVAVGLFIGVFIAARMLGGLLAKALAGIGLGGADRVLGAVLGVARALVIVLLVAIAGHLTGFSQQPGWQQAWSRPLLDELVRWTEPFLPERLSGVQQT